MPRYAQRGEETRRRGWGESAWDSIVMPLCQAGMACRQGLLGAAHPVSSMGAVAARMTVSGISAAMMSLGGVPFMTGGGVSMVGGGVLVSFMVGVLGGARGGGGRPTGSWESVVGVVAGMVAGLWRPTLSKRDIVAGKAGRSQM